MREWDSNSKITKEGMERLDMTRGKGGSMDDITRMEDIGSTEIEEQDRSVGGEDGSSSGWGSKLSSFFNTLTGQKALDCDDLAPALESMRKQLISKNVAIDIADELCRSVETHLVGQKPGR